MKIWKLIKPITWRKPNCRGRCCHLRTSYDFRLIWMKKPRKRSRSLMVKSPMWPALAVAENRYFSRSLRIQMIKSDRSEYSCKCLRTIAFRRKTLLRSLRIRSDRTPLTARLCNLRIKHLCDNLSTKDTASARSSKRTLSPTTSSSSCKTTWLLRKWHEGR